MCIRDRTLALHLNHVRGRVNKPANLLALAVHVLLPVLAIHIQMCIRDRYMAEHISGPKGFCLVAEEKTTGALAAYFTVKLAGTAPDALDVYKRQGHAADNGIGKMFRAGG